MSTIKKVTLVGGTHGNEYSGIFLLNKWKIQPALIKRPSFDTQTLLGNPGAYRDNRRYLDNDLNRQFTLEDLANPALENHEQNRAKVINRQLGPKGKAKTDLIIDLHNTTSNMGPTLILLKVDRFNTQLAAYIKECMAKAVILFEDNDNKTEHPFLCSIAEQGIIIEVGPQAQSVIRQDVLELMEEMTKHVLDFVERFNHNEELNLPRSISAFRYIRTLKLPTDKHGEPNGIIHKNVQDTDFNPLKKGDPIFSLFDGKEICWEEDNVVYPHFINEAAYYDENLAMSLAQKVNIEVIF